MSFQAQRSAHVGYQPIGRKVFRERTGAWINPNKPQVILCQGMRGAGKSVLDEMAAEQLYLQGWTILDLLAARNAENLFWCINKNCKEKYRKDIIDDPSKRGMPHCNCSTRYPIILLVPEYLEFDRAKLDRFNNVFLTKAEYVRMCYEKGWVPEWDSKNPPRRDKLFKDWQPIMKIRHLPAPTTTGSNKEIIENIFMNTVIQARKEHRVVCFNPMFYPNEYHKFRTLEIIIRSLGRMMYTHFRPLTEKEVGHPRIDPVTGKPLWTKYQRNYHRVAVVMREFGEVTAAVLKGENQSTMAKKALLDYIRQTRHYNISLIGDYQRPDDVFSGIRDQADIFILKRAPRKLLGDNWKWMFDDIEKRREKIIFKYGIQKGTQIADNKIPKIQELGPNYAYVVYVNDTYKLWKIPTPNFHHKQGEDHFEVVTNLTWVEKPHGKMSPKITKISEKNQEEALKDTWEAKMYDTIRGMVRPLAPKKPKKWSQVYEDIALMVSNGVLDMPASWSTPDAMRKWFSRKEKKVLAPMK